MGTRQQDPVQQALRIMSPNSMTSSNRRTMTPLRNMTSLRQDSPVSEIMKEDDMDLPYLIIKGLECITWENPFVWAALPFWLPIALFVYTVALLVLWSMPRAQNSKREDDAALDQNTEDDDSDDEEEKLAEMLDFGAIRQLLAVLVMIPFLVPIALCKVIIDKFKNSRFRVSRSGDRQSQNHRKWKFRLLKRS